MTNEEAASELTDLRIWEYITDDETQALDLAIAALREVERLKSENAQLKAKCNQLQQELYARPER